MEIEMTNKKIIKFLGKCVLLLIGVYGLICIIDKGINYVDLIKRIDSTSLVSEDFDYSDNISSNYNFKLDNSIDKFILSYNKNLSTKDIWTIKFLTKKYTKSADDYTLMLSLYSIESNFYKNANSFLGAEYGRGLGQISEIALKEYNRKNNTDIKPLELYNEEINIKISCWLYYYYQDLYKLDTVGTLMVYNKGFGGYSKNRNDIGYSNKILNNKIKLG